MKYIFILRLLGSDIDTGEIEWHDVVKVSNLTFQVCIENVVDTVNVLQNAGIKHEVLCKKQVEETEDK